MFSSLALVALEPGIGADDDKIRVFGNRTGNFGAKTLRFGFSFRTGHLFQRSGKDDCFAGQRRVIVRFINIFLYVYPAEQFFYDIDVMLFLEKFDNIRGHRGADAVDSYKFGGFFFLHIVHKMTECSIVFGQQQCCCGANLTDA